MQDSPLGIGVVTNTEDPLQYIFWDAYRRAGGVPVSDVFLVEPGGGDARPAWRKLLDPVLIFGVRDCARLALHSARQRRPQTYGSLANGSSLRVHRVEKLTAEVLTGLLGNRRLDLLVSLGAPRILPLAVLKAARIGTVNIHNGRLPRYRGQLGTFWELYHGEAEGFVTLHEMVEKVDSGRTICRGAVALEAGSPMLRALIDKKRIGGSLLARVTRHVAGHGVLPTDWYTETAGQQPGYFNWPTLQQCREFSWRKAPRRGNE